MEDKMQDKPRSFSVVELPKVRALYDFKGTDVVELSFQAGDEIIWHGSDESGWAEGEVNGKTGWFPSRCVDTLDLIQYEDQRVDREKATRKLSVFLTSRPSVDELRNKNILQGARLTTSESYDNLPALTKSVSTDNLAALPGVAYSPRQSARRKASTMSKLKSLLVNRPSKEKLEEKQIILNDEKRREISKKKTFLNLFLKQRVPQTKIQRIIKEPIFGVALVDFGDKVPAVVGDCLSVLKDQGLNCEGLFRVNGSQSEIDALRKAVEDKKSILLMPESASVHNVASLLKRFLIQLPEPVINFEVQNDLRESLALEGKQQQLEACKKALGLLERTHRLVLRDLISFFSLLAENSGKNLMTSSNLGIIFGPTLMRSKSLDIMDGLSESARLNNTLITFLIDNYNQLFMNM
eukprot:TRINITY_DN11739_c0_g1_i1.p1 TRINITY_DN11739_c0_g1~~TRINITY_DN11739_c0_g1_i1.p1  ORF type:complete len:428 (+),score=85.58 TRINITY_DN11739_c0_g1_i1:59-1285(+)